MKALTPGGAASLAAAPDGAALLCCLVVASLAWTLLAPTIAHAQTVDDSTLARRQAKLESNEGWVTMTVGWRDVVSPAIRGKLLSGLPTVIASRVYVFEDRARKPVGLNATTCRVVFDLWDEVFRIELRQRGRARQTVAVNVEGVLRRCAEARRQRIVSLAALAQRERYFIGVLAEVNPLSEEMMERIKRWVARPTGSGALGPGDSLFGSFVGLFITRVPAADAAVSFRTQAFVPASLPAVPKPKQRRAAR